MQAGSHTLTYRVTRLNQGAEIQTPPTRIYVKLEVPGGQDIDPEPGHSNLFMYIPPKVVNGEVERLDAPIAEDAHQGAIDPDLPAPRIRIPHNELIKEGMAIELSWLGTRLDGSTYNPILDWYLPSKSEADNPQGFTISVEGTHLKTLEGGKLDLSYALLSEKDNGGILRRESQKAAQLNVGEPFLELVAPSVLGEQDGALEPNDLPNGTSLLTAPKSAVKPTQANDVVTYTWTGEVSGKTEDSIILNSLSAGKDVNFHLDAAFVAKHIELNRGKKIAASYRIWRAETDTSSYSNALVFTVGLELEAPAINSVKDSKGVEIPHGGTTTDINLRLTGTASKGRQVDLLAGAVSIGKATTNPSTGIWELAISELSIAAYSFIAKAEYGEGPVSAARDVIITPIEAFENFENVNIGQFNELKLATMHISTPYPGIQIQAITHSPYITGKAVRIS